MTIKPEDVKETPIERGTILTWYGTVTSIPAGWEVADGGRHDYQDGSSYTRPNLIDHCVRCIPTGGLVNLTTQGAATHVHDIAAHTHPLGVATTTVNLGNGSGGGGIDDNHGHGSQAMVGTSTYGAIANSVVGLEGIPIVYIEQGWSASGPRLHDYLADCLLPYKGICFWPSDTLPARGWTKSNGSVVNGVTTLDLSDKFLKGVANGSTDPGGTGGSNSPHTHSDTHTHNSGARNGGHNDKGEGSNHTTFADTDHGHLMQNATAASTAGSHLPKHKIINFLTFTGVGSSQADHVTARLRANDLHARLLVPRGVVMVWGHSLASIPTGWKLCDGGAWDHGTPTGYGSTRPNMLDKFHKHVATAATDGGASSGSTSHTHTGGTTHVHSLGNDTGPYLSGESDQSDTTTCSDHGHGNSAAAGGTVSTVSNLEPAYKRVAFIVRD